MTEQVLDGAQIVRVHVGESGAGMPQGMVRDAGPFQIELVRVAVDELSEAPPTEPLAASPIADGGEQRHTARVGWQIAALLEYFGLRDLGDLPPFSSFLEALAREDDQFVVPAGWGL